MVLHCVVPTFFIFLSSNRITAYRSLDLTGPLMFGGLPPLSVRFPVSETSFSGCIKNVSIDHMFLDLGKPVMDNSSSVKCSAKRDFCESKPCTRGVCKNSWRSFLCKCPEGYGGKKCDLGEWKCKKDVIFQFFKPWKVVQNLKIACLVLKNLKLVFLKQIYFFSYPEGCRSFFL